MRIPSFTTVASCLLLATAGAQAQKFTWSAPVPFGALNADQILTNFPGAKIAAALRVNGGPTTVTLSTGQQIIFGNVGTWASVSGGNGFNNNALPGGAGSLTGNTNFDTCLGNYYFDGATHTITMSNLVVGKQYSVQLFALDNRTGLNPAANTRTVSWQDPNNAGNVSATYSMADNAYLVGTFTASAAVESIQENMLNADAGNFNCLVLRAVGWTPPPAIVAQPVNGGG